MKRELFNKWISALRSGNYKQGKGLLCNNDKFCCLGVFLDVLKEEYTLNYAKVRVYDGNEAGILPTKIVEKYGFYSAFGGSVNNSDKSLAIYNDVYNISFPAIADKLEARPEVFVIIED